MTKSIIGAIGDMDAYQLPDAKGYTSMVRYLLGKSDESRQQTRDEMLATSVDDLRTFADVLATLDDRHASSSWVQPRAECRQRAGWPPTQNHKGDVCASPAASNRSSLPGRGRPMPSIWRRWWPRRRRVARRCCSSPNTPG